MPVRSRNGIQLNSVIYAVCAKVNKQVTHTVVLSSIYSKLQQHNANAHASQTLCALSVAFKSELILFSQFFLLLFDFIYFTLFLQFFSSCIYSFGTKIVCSFVCVCVCMFRPVRWIQRMINLFLDLKIHFFRTNDFFFCRGILDFCLSVALKTSFISCRWWQPLLISSNRSLSNLKLRLKTPNPLQTEFKTTWTIDGKF